MRFQQKMRHMSGMQPFVCREPSEDRRPLIQREDARDAAQDSRTAAAGAADVDASRITAPRPLLLRCTGRARLSPPPQWRVAVFASSTAH